MSKRAVVAQLRSLARKIDIQPSMSQADSLVRMMYKGGYSDEGINMEDPDVKLTRDMIAHLIDECQLVSKRINGLADKINAS